jgi:putative hydrolase of the HAD superfamily
MILAFDGDDTLWHNEDEYQATHRELEELLAPWADADTVEARLLAIETENLPRFGYGAKSFTLSMIETAIDLSDTEADAEIISRIMTLGKRLTDRPAVLIDGVTAALDRLTEHTLMIITKGDLHAQLMKVETSGLSSRMKWIEVVAEKDVSTYSAILERHGIAVDDFVMIGNSVRSDVLPVMELGAVAVHIPYAVTWQHEEADNGHGHELVTLTHIGELPAWLERRR